MNYNREWYDSLIKPKFMPPAWIFAPVWIILYILMFISIGLVFAAPFRILNIFGYVVFTAQLAVNFRWVPVFFREHNLRKAFLLCVLLDILILTTIILFFQISKTAAYLLLPYLLWGLYATVLNFEILDLNEW